MPYKGEEKHLMLPLSESIILLHNVVPNPIPFLFTFDSNLRFENKENSFYYESKSIPIPESLIFKTK